MDEVTLKPCRWCGGKAKCNELRRGNYKREGDNYQVVCNKCRARGPLIQDSSAQAISAWNQRADAQVEAVAAQDVAALVEASVHMAASLAAAISLLKRGGKAAKKAAPSDRMFDQMIADYEAALNRARTALAKHERTPHDRAV